MMQGPEAGDKEGDGDSEKMEAFCEFLATYPAYRETMVIDSLRREEYGHLEEESGGAESSVEQIGAEDGAAGDHTDEDEDQIEKQKSGGGGGGGGRRRRRRRRRRSRSFKQVCLDYTGVGLFSNSQQIVRETGYGDGGASASASASAAMAFGLSYISLNLATHAMYPEDGGLEAAFRDRILRYLNLDKEDFYLVFTANSISAFKLLGESYPFHESPNLLLAYDHRSDEIEALRECAASRRRSKPASASASASAAARPSSKVLAMAAMAGGGDGGGGGGFTRFVNLALPHLKIDPEDLRRKLLLASPSPSQSPSQSPSPSPAPPSSASASSGRSAARRIHLRRRSYGYGYNGYNGYGDSSASPAIKGLFAFPYSSRVTGCRNSSRWIQDAQSHGWHVLLDVTSMDAKMLGSLGLSLFLPDFVICSFYHVFGRDPAGIGCLAIRKTALRALGDSSRARSVGMVKIVPKNHASAGAAIHGSFIYNCLASDPCRGDANYGGAGGGADGDGDSDGSGDESDGDKSDGDGDESGDESNDDGGDGDERLERSNGGLLRHHHHPPPPLPLPLHRRHESDPGSSLPVHDQLPDSMLSADVDLQIDRSLFYDRPDPEIDILPIMDPTRFSALTNSKDKSHHHPHPLDIDESSVHAPATSGQGSSAGSSASTSALHPCDRQAMMRSDACDSAEVQAKSLGRPHHREDPWMPWDLLSQHRDYESFYNQVDSQRRQNAENLGPLREMPVYDARVRSSEIDESRSTKKPSPSSGLGASSSASHGVKGLFYLNRNSSQHNTATIDDASEERRKEPWKIAGHGAGHAGTSKLHQEMAIETEWRAFYARKAKFRISASSSSMSSGVSGPPRMDQITDTEICCRGLDQADILGYKRIAIRLRSLSSWLISSLSALRHPGENSPKLVRIYTQASPINRGSTVAFSLLDSAGKALDPHRVQLLADRNNISLRVGIIEGTLSAASAVDADSYGNDHSRTIESFFSSCLDLPSHKWRSRGDSIQSIQAPVVYASLGFLNNFSDVYKLWSFVKKLLDPDFVHRELWHYQALNQETIEI